MAVPLSIDDPSQIRLVAGGAECSPGRGNSEETALNKVYLVVIEPRRFMRECLTQGLAGASRDCTILGFARLEDWRASSASLHAEDTIILRYTTTKRSRREFTEEVRALTTSEPGPKLVFISHDDDPADEIVETLNDGAKGYVSTSLSLHVACEALRLVAAGGVYVPATSLLTRPAVAESEGSCTQLRKMFTPRQNAVLEEIQKGKANKIIAYDLQMKESTVKVHVRNIMRKVGATNRTEVAIKALSLDGRLARTG